MFKLFLISLLFLLSCGYPDIDTVPDFKDVIITEEDSIEFCKMNNPYISPSNVDNNYKRLKCFEKLNKVTNRL